MPPATSRTNTISRIIAVPELPPSSVSSTVSSGFSGVPASSPSQRFNVLTVIGSFGRFHVLSIVRRFRCFHVFPVVGCFGRFGLFYVRRFVGFLREFQPPAVVRVLRVTSGAAACRKVEPCELFAVLVHRWLQANRRKCRHSQPVRTHRRQAA